MEFSRLKHPEIFAVLKRINNDKNLYVTSLNDKKISPEIDRFVDSLRRSFSGDTIPALPGKGKPVQFKPMLKLEDPADSEHYSIVKPKIKILPGDSPGEYLDTFNLYINEACLLECDFCSTAYRQFLCCRRHEGKRNSKELPVSHILALCDQLKETNLLNLNILGGNFLLHNEITRIIKIFNETPSKKNWYIHYRNLLNEIKLPASLREGNNLLHLICDPTISKEVLNAARNRIVQSSLPAIFHFILTSGDDFIAAAATAEEFGIEDIEFHPFYISGDSNLDFFEENIFIDRASIEESELKMQDIFARRTLNTINFKQLTMMCDGHVFANVNHPSLGKFPKNTLAELIKKKLIRGTSWGRIRKNVTPCKSCPYNALCPPISNYEYNLGRYNLCHVNS